MSLIEWLKGAAGDFANVDQPGPLPVAVVPNDFPPPIAWRGVMGMGLAAGGIGLRTECLLIGIPGVAAPSTVIWIPRIGLKGITAGAEFEIIRPDSGVVGFTDLPFISADMRAGRGAFRVQQKNNTAADPGIAVADNLWGPVNNDNNNYEWYRVNLILETRGLSHQVIVRPNADNVGMYLACEYYELRPRTL